MTGRLSTLAAAFVVARRDFVAILFSRSFIFFLLGPLFPIVVGVLAGGIGSKVREEAAAGARSPAESAQSPHEAGEEVTLRNILVGRSAW